MSSWAVGKCSWGAEIFPDFPRILVASENVVHQVIADDKRNTDLVINLRLILVSGKTKEFLFGPNDSAGDIAQHVFDNWPEDWCDEAVAKADILRLIYQGRFLHSNVTLGALGLACSKTTVMHLVPRENLPEPNSQGRNVATPSGHVMWNDDLSPTLEEWELIQATNSFSTNDPYNDDPTVPERLTQEEWEAFTNLIQATNSLSANGPNTVDPTVPQNPNTNLTPTPSLVNATRSCNSDSNICPSVSTSESPHTNQTSTLPDVPAPITSDGSAPTALDDTLSPTPSEVTAEHVVLHSGLNDSSPSVDVSVPNTTQENILTITDPNVALPSSDPNA